MSKEKKKTKKKKQKVTYIDDGRSLADMSGGSGQRHLRSSAKGTLSEQAKTFFTAMKMMVKPMLVTMGIITVAFFIVWLLLKLAG